jgi:hypothetical protein
MAPNLTLDEIARRAAAATKRIQEQVAEEPPKPKLKKPSKNVQLPDPSPEQVTPMKRTMANVAMIKSPPPDMEDSFVKAFIQSVQETGIKLDKKQTESLMSGFGTFKSSINYLGILKRCPGDNPDRHCEHFAICPFTSLDGDHFPVGQPCPLERIIADKEMAEYIRMIGLTPDMLPLAIINQIYSLIECDISEIRMRNKINEIGYKTSKPIFAVNKTGEVVEAEEISIEFEIQDRVQRRKEKIMQSLMFTPEIRTKYKVLESGNKEMSPVEAVAFVRTKLLEQKNKPTTEG